MDPQATLRMAQDAIDDLAVDTTDADADDLYRDLMASYWRWRESGGFEPIMPDGTPGDVERDNLVSRYSDLFTVKV